MTLNVQPPTTNIAARIQGSVPDVSVAATTTTEDEVPNAVKAAQSLNGVVAEKNNKNTPHDGDKEVRRA